MQKPKSWSSTWWSISRALWGVNFQLRTATVLNRPVTLLTPPPEFAASIGWQLHEIYFLQHRATKKHAVFLEVSSVQYDSRKSRAASKQGRVCLREILIQIDANSFWIMLRSNISMNSQETCTKTSTFAFLITAKLGSASCAWKGSLVYWINFCICRMGKSIRYKTTNISMIWLQDQPFATTPCVRISSYS